MPRRAPHELRRDRELRQGPGEAAGDQARPAQAGEELPADRQGRAASRRASTSRPASRSTPCDVQVPGMVYGTLARAPVRGSGPTSFNGDEMKKLPGIIDAVALDHGVGIIGNTVEAVFAARGKLKAQWRDAPGSKVELDREPARLPRPRARPARKGVVGRTVWRRQRGDRRRGQGARQRIHHRPRLSRADGAACLRRIGHAERRRGVDRHAMADQGGGRSRQGRGHDARQGHAAPDADGRLVRPQHLRRLRDRRGEPVESRRQAGEDDPEPRATT